MWRPRAGRGQLLSAKAKLSLLRIPPLHRIYAAAIHSPSTALALPTSPSPTPPAPSPPATPPPSAPAISPPHPPGKARNARPSSPRHSPSRESQSSWSYIFPRPPSHSAISPPIRPARHIVCARHTPATSLPSSCSNPHSLNTSASRSDPASPATRAPQPRPPAPVPCSTPSSAPPCPLSVPARSGASHISSSPDS